jgi:hypothetical protein
MFTIVLLTIYLDEAPSAITILALFPENKKAVRTKLKFLENKKSAIRIKLEFFFQNCFLKIHPAINGMGRLGYRKNTFLFFLGGGATEKLRHSMQSFINTLARPWPAWCSG